MLTYDTLARKPSAFKSMPGLTVDEFEELLADLRPRDEAARQERHAATPRRRAPGGGAKPRYALRERLLMTLVWLRLYLTGDALGVLFDVDKSTVSRYTRPLLRLLRDGGRTRWVGRRRPARCWTRRTARTARTARTTGRNFSAAALAPSTSPRQSRRPMAPRKRTRAGLSQGRQTCVTTW